jgi:hypothetical protein
MNTLESEGASLNARSGLEGLANVADVQSIPCVQEVEIFGGSWKRPGPAPAQTLNWSCAGVQPAASPSHATRLGHHPDDVNLSRLEFMAAASPRISPERGAVLEALLDATLPKTYDGHRMLQPLWANEAMQRAYTTICLVKSLERLTPVPRRSSPVALIELGLANDIARLIKSVTYSDAVAPISCSSIVRNLVQDMVELFGPIAGDVAIETCIEQVTLPSFKARAIVLLAQDLLVNVLRYGLQSPDGGRIVVSLCRTAQTTARLSVIDSGSGFAGVRPNPCSVAYDLASLLEAVPSYRVTAGSGVTVYADFTTGT